MTSLRLLPRPRQIDFDPGHFSLPTRTALYFTPGLRHLPSLAAGEWRAETGRTPTLRTLRHPTPFAFALADETGDAPPIPAGWEPDTLPASGEAYRLDITPRGLFAVARSHPGLVHAWQTLKQILRHAPDTLPALRIVDYPDLAWRVYHLDLKGTRHTPDQLYALLPLLAEFKINAILAEYEDALRLPRHPEFARPEAWTPDELRPWLDRAADYGIAVIPLIQTLGHLQYILRHPPFQHLAEKSGDPSEACCTHPETWPLVRDLLDDLIDLHPQAPFIHVGLDETFHVGTCPRCGQVRGDRPPMTLYVDWLNRVARYVAGRGLRPLVWGSMVGPHLLTPAAQAIDPAITFVVNGGYEVTGPVTPRLDTFSRGRISREWLRRPEGEIHSLPPLHYRGGAVIEDLPPPDLETARALSEAPDFPVWVRAHTGLSLFTRQGFAAGVVSGIRISAHGCVVPKFITGQLNTLTGAEACRRHPRAQILIGSSWARGHSLAPPNAHPGLDAYGLATLGDAGWSPLDRHELREFDGRFAFQFLGLPDESIGDLLFLFERTSPRVDHQMSDYLTRIRAGCADLQPRVRRHPEFVDLLARMAEVQSLRFKAQFALLEWEYCFAVRDRIPPAFSARVRADAQALVRDLDAATDPLRRFYAQTLLPADAAELVATQFDFLRHQLERLLDAPTFPNPTPKK